MNNSGKIRNTLWILACFLLVGGNIAFFLLFPHILSGVSIVLSNVITLLLTFLAFRPLNNWLQSNLLQRQQELIEKMEKDRELENKVRSLELQNRDLSDRLDTRLQTGALPSEVDYTFKVEQMEYAKTGYVVKEEDLDRLDKEQFAVPDRRFLESVWEDNIIKAPSIRKILYIHKFYYKVTLGIDFSKILYTRNDDTLLFYGVRFEKLHDISNELVQDGEDIDRCEIIKVNLDRTEVRNDAQFDELKEQYRTAQEESVRESMEQEVSVLCGQYTVALQESIRTRFGNKVGFIDSIEPYRDKNWFTLQATTDLGVREVAANMLMLTTVMNKTQAIAIDHED